MTLPYDPIVEIKGKHAQKLAKQLKNPKRNERQIQTSSDAQRTFQKHNQPKGGIIKITKPDGTWLYRIWLDKGMDRGKEFPQQKWDFNATMHNHTTGEEEVEVRVQIEMTFEEVEE